MILSDNFQALLVAACGGVVAALYKLSLERKKTGSDYDWVDFVLLSVTASFAGVIGFFLASWKFEDPSMVLGMTGIASIGGYPMLLGISEHAFSVAKDKLNTPILGTGASREPYRYTDAYGQVEGPPEPYKAAQGRTERYRGP